MTRVTKLIKLFHTANVPLHLGCLDSDLRGRDEISTLNLFRYIFMEHDIVILAPPVRI